MYVSLLADLGKHQTCTQ